MLYKTSAKLQLKNFNTANQPKTLGYQHKKLLSMFKSF